MLHKPRIKQNLAHGVISSFFKNEPRMVFFSINDLQIACEEQMPQSREAEPLRMLPAHLDTMGALQFQTEPTTGPWKQACIIESDKNLCESLQSFLDTRCIHWASYTFKFLRTGGIKCFGHSQVTKCHNSYRAGPLRTHVKFSG